MSLLLKDFYSAMAIAMVVLGILVFFTLDQDIPTEELRTIAKSWTFISVLSHIALVINLML